MKLFKMEKDKDYKKAKDTATAIVILLLAVGFILNWWEINVKFIGCTCNRKVGVPPSIVRC